MDEGNGTPATGSRIAHASILLALLLAVLIGCVFFGRFVPARLAITRLLWPLLAALLALLASCACGKASIDLCRIIVARMSPLSPERSDRWNDRVVLGVPAYGLLLSAVAIIGIALGPITIVVTLLLAIVGALQLRGRWRELCPALTPLRLMLFAPPATVAFLGAITPVASPDEMVYKLALAKTYLLFGRMLELPLNSQSYIPSATFMSEMGPLALSGGIAAKLLFFFLFLACLRAIHNLATRVSPASADLAAAVFCWTPALLLLAGWCWSEWSVLGLAAVSYRAWDEFNDGSRSADFATSFLALALAVSTKYTVLLWVVIFIPITVIATARMKLTRRLAAPAVVIMALFGGFFFVRNLVWTGSPIAPFLLPNSPAVTNFRGGTETNGLQEMVRGYDILHPGIIDDSLGILLPVVVLMSPLVLLRRRRITIELFAIGGLQLAALVAISPTSRLIILGLLPLAILGTDMMIQGWLASRSLIRSVLVALVVTAFAGQLLLVSYVFVVSYDFFSYVVGKESEPQLVARTRAFTPVYEWAAAHTDPNSRFLLLGENRPFYLDRPSFAASNLDGPRVNAYLSHFPTAETLRQDFLRIGVSHVLIHKPWYSIVTPSSPRPGMLQREYILELTPQTDATLRDFIRRFTIRRYEDAQYAVFEVH
ncbi:MAG TPA: hypothetical protein VHL58_19440 [Thermoanaerobaculia bacterium]|nr:hypothetical protein [Thermoanaerobaculia bacterium]